MIGVSPLGSTAAHTSLSRKPGFDGFRPLLMLPENEEGHTAQVSWLLAFPASFLERLASPSSSY